MKKIRPTSHHVKMFTQGDCWILAAAISAITGWPSCAFSTGYGGPDTHAFVRTPAGTILDIHGENPEYDLRIRWGQQDSDIIEWDDFEEDGWGQIFDGSRELAKDYAEALVEVYHYNREYK